MGRPPIGKVAMTGAERVRRHRLKQSGTHADTGGMNMGGGGKHEPSIAFKSIYRNINANFAHTNLARSINFWLQNHSNADPQTHADHAELRIVGEPEFSESGPMEYEFNVKLRVDMRRRKSIRRKK